jgi:glycosyltransferase involved in cell wall biosynthesis
MLAGISDAQLRVLYSHAAALLAASFEDFGLTPVEAAGFGTPTIALRRGGYLDTVIEGVTGVFFDHPDAAHIRAAIEGFRGGSFSAAKIRAHARGFSPEVFVDAITERVIDLAARG